ncbi:MAG: fluoride efflux transporter CrcB [Gemmatimonadota bacterium]|jgi:CrcB protein|nr:fluoride efflux transporter CrcB [Gemmatimonadota bacterium]
MNRLTLPLVTAVALGGAIGSVARYAVGVWLARAGGTFPVATLLINVTGSFLIGLFARLFEAPDANPVLRAALTVGLCGGFTTFSTFSAETIALLQQGRAARAAVYVTVSIVAGVLATFAGLLLGRTAR